MVKVNLGLNNYETTISIQEHSLISDEPLEKGGKDKGPTPKKLFLSGLGSCVAITLRMYSQTKGWDVGEITVDLDLEEEKGNKRIFEKISFGNKDLSPEQVKRLHQIAHRCPVSRMIEEGTKIESTIE